MGTADEAAGTDIVKSMAERAGATITEIDGSQPDAVTEVILTALKAVGETSGVAVPA